MAGHMYDVPMTRILQEGSGQAGDNGVTLINFIHATATDGLVVLERERMTSKYPP
jgi:hypothetical protein